MKCPKCHGRMAPETAYDVPSEHCLNCGYLVMGERPVIMQKTPDIMKRNQPNDNFTQYPEELLTTVRDLYLRGYTYKDISEKSASPFGSIDRIIKHLIRRGMPVRDPRNIDCESAGNRRKWRPLNTDEKVYILSALNLNQNINQIAKVLNRPHTSISTYITRHNERTKLAQIWAAGEKQEVNHV